MTSHAAELGAGVASGERFVPRDELLERSARAATALAEAGVGAGDTVALVLRNDIAYFEATLAAGALGAYAVPVNWHYRGPEAGFILADCAAKVVVAHADLLPNLEGAVPPGSTLAVVATPPEVAAAYHLDASVCAVPEWANGWQDWIATRPPLAERRAAPPSMIYTSGTTGRPKGVRRAAYGRENLPALAAISREVLGIEAGMRTVIPAPLYHTAPNTYALAAFLAGGTVILQARFDATELLHLIGRFGLTHLQVVPTMFVRFLRLPEKTRAGSDISSLRHVVHAAAPCPPQVKQAMIDWWGPIIVEYYGCTESGIITAATSTEWQAHPGSVGRPVTGATVQILGDDGSSLPAGTPGEVHVRNHFFGDFTYQNCEQAPEGSSALMTCGDIGYLDTEGYLYLCDRKTDVVITGGANVYPAEIEAALLGLEGVADCAVFGIPDDDLGEVLAAAVEPEPGYRLDETTVITHLRTHLAGVKIPRLVTFHDRLPREDSGKIFKRRLRQPYWEGTGRNI